MPTPMPMVRGVLAALVACVVLAGCAGGPAKLPTCSGTAVPINGPAGAAATAGSVSGAR